VTIHQLFHLWIFLRRNLFEKTLQKAGNMLL